MVIFLNFRHIKLLIKNKLTVISIVFCFFNLKYFGGSRNRLYLSRWVVEWKSLGTPAVNYTGQCFIILQNQ